MLTLLGDDGRSARVLAKRQHPLGRDFGIAQQGQGDIAVILGGQRIVKDRRHLFEMLLAQQERTIAHCVVRQVGEGLGLHFEDLPAIKCARPDEILCEEAIMGRILAQGERFLVAERRDGHGGSTLGDRRE